MVSLGSISKGGYGIWFLFKFQITPCLFAGLSQNFITMFLSSVIYVHSDKWVNIYGDLKCNWLIYHSETCSSKGLEKHSWMSKSFWALSHNI